MKLTRRQEEFIDNLLDLNQEFDGPIHYSVLAERLGVSPFTAYDMLCVLEGKGKVTSEYQLASDKSGPGRAERVFYTTETMQEHKQLLEKELAGKILNEAELKQYVVGRLQKGNGPYKGLLLEMLALPSTDDQGGLGFCIEVMTVVAFRLQQSSGQAVFREYFAEIIPQSAKACRGTLAMLVGFAFGILAQEYSSDQEWVGKLFDQVQQYQDVVMEMNPDDCRRLGEYVRTVFT